MIRKYFFCAAIVAALLMTGCSKSDPETPSVEEQVDELIESMSLKQLVCQLFVVRPEALSENPGTDGKTALTKEMEDFYREYPVGGLCLYAKNIVSPSQLLTYTQDIHSLPGHPLLYVDEEGGRVARIANSEGFGLNKYESMSAIASSGNPDDAYDAAFYIGSYVRQYGFDIDLAPVADVNTNPENIVIGARAFSSDPQLASQMVLRYLDGLWKAGIHGCIKHFPGHGDVKGDTHTGYVATQKTWEDLLKCEMVTFKAGIQHGVRMIMTAHISTPTITGNDLPATMSSVILSEKLRGELGFKGIIITDAMEMGAIAEHYSSGESAVGTLTAGADIILLPQNLPEAVDAILDALDSGEITVDRIKESVRRILELKLASIR